MTDPYLQALDDVAAELTKLHQRGPDLPAFHRDQILEQLGALAGAIEELRRRRQAPAQDPGPVPSDWQPPDPRLDLMRGFHDLATGQPPTGHHQPIGGQVEFGPPKSAPETAPAPSALAPGYYWIVKNWLVQPEYEPAKLAYTSAGLDHWHLLGDDCHLWDDPSVIGPRLIPPAAPAPASEPADPVAEDRAEWDAAPRW